MTGVRIDNDPSGDPGGGGGGSLGELLRLQTQFQARLAEETIAYLRRLQGAAAPNAPGTVVVPAEGESLAARGAPGGVAELVIEIENRQRVHCMVTPQLGPLVDATGVTWSPAVEAAPPSQLVGPGEVTALTLHVAIPPELPTGTYRGVLILQGFRDGGVPVSVEVAAP